VFDSWSVNNLEVSRIAAAGEVAIMHAAVGLAG
jgi:hypothetical protein